jgi:hypothetical protein
VPTFDIFRDKAIVDPSIAVADHFVTAIHEGAGQLRILFESASNGENADLDVEIIEDVEDPPHPATTGTRIAAHLTSIGHVLLRSLSNEELDRYIQGLKLHAYTAHTIRSPNELRRKIVETQKTGWSFVRQQHENNACGIAVGIRDSSGRIIAGLNVSQIVSDKVEKTSIDHILPILRVASEKRLLTSSLILPAYRAEPLKAHGQDRNRRHFPGLDIRTDRGGVREPATDQTFARQSPLTRRPASAAMGCFERGSEAYHPPARCPAANASGGIHLRL